MNGWIPLQRSREAEELLAKDPQAFCLLTQVALRARWVEEPDRLTGLLFRQCRIGDFKEAGLASENRYRRAKEVLERAGYAAFTGTKRGTIAMLLDSPIYRILAGAGGDQEDEPGADAGRTGGGQRATKEEGKKEKPKKGNTPKVVPFAPLPDFLEALWETAPAKSRERSEGKKSVAKAWEAIPDAERPTNEELLAAMEAWKRSGNWAEEQYIPGLHRWLAHRKWETPPLPAQPVRARIQISC